MADKPERTIKLACTWVIEATIRKIVEVTIPNAPSVEEMSDEDLIKLYAVDNDWAEDDLKHCKEVQPDVMSCGRGVLIDSDVDTFSTCAAVAGERADVKITVTPFDDDVVEGKDV